MKILLLFIVFVVAAPVQAQVGASWAAAGRTRLSLTAGYVSSHEKDYAVIGAGAGYYLLNGLEAGLDGEAWMGSKPHIYSVSPGLRYTFTQMESMKPYVGGFYKRTFYDTLSDLSSAGGRAGVSSTLGEHTYLNAGLVYEKFFNCSETIYTDCDQLYPELGISFTY